VNDEHNSFSRQKNRRDLGRVRAIENLRQRRRVQWFHDRSFTRTREESEQDRYNAQLKHSNRLHLGGVFIKGNTGLD